MSQPIFETSKKSWTWSGEQFPTVAFYSNRIEYFDGAKRKSVLYKVISKVEKKCPWIGSTSNNPLMKVMRFFVGGWQWDLRIYTSQGICFVELNDIKELETAYQTLMNVL